MSETKARQLNNYIRLPMSLLSLLPLGQAYVLGDVFSFTGKGNACRRTYKSFGSRTGNSRATVARALSKGKAQGFIMQDKEKGYVFNLDKVKGDKFLRVLDWIITEKFTVRKDEKRRMLPSERTVYTFIYTRCDNMKSRTKSCIVSISEIAEAVGLSERTVQRARLTLIRAGLIYCPLKDKGVNAYKKSRYTLNYKLIRAHEKKARTENKPVTASTEPQQPQTLQEIEQAYKDKRERAELIAERNLIRAREYDKFKIADEAYTYMGVSAAFAHFQNPEKAAEYERRLAQAKAQRLIALRDIGLTEADIEPQYECKLCNDTGQLENGARCKCFPRGEPPTDGENVGAGERNK